MKKLYALVVLGLFIGVNASHLSYERNLDQKEQKAARRRARAEKRAEKQNRAKASNVGYSSYDYSGNTDLSKYTFDTNDEEGNEENID